MDKKLLTSIVIIILFVGAFFLFNKYMPSKKENGIIKINMQNQASKNIKVTPIEHASMILSWDGAVIYTDPVGKDKFAGSPTPDIILVTDIHEDHLDVEALKAVTAEKTIIIAPKAVVDKLPDELKFQVYMMKNGDITNPLGFKIEAVPMYNLPESETSYHTKGRGNGYVVEKNGTRVYISGDTSGIPEMRNLKDIDIAFVCMNLPYTMSVEEAADAVLQFKPKKVYPYHYRTADGFSDVAKFKKLVNAGNYDIEVVQLDWYSKS